MKFFKIQNPRASGAVFLTTSLALGLTSLSCAAPAAKVPAAANALAAKNALTWGEMQQPSGDFPADVGMNSVKDFGAKGDGVTDDTAAIQRAILASRDAFKTVYFPNGTYLVSRTLRIGQSKQDVQYTSFQGQSRDGAILKLRDSAPGFDNPNAPQYLFTMFDGGTTGDAFGMRVFDLTFEVGKNNPGATALQWMNNNEGALSNVTIRSLDGRGFAGIDLARSEPGPGIFRNVLVEGFDYGVYSTIVVFSMFMENITLRNQNKAGIYNVNQTLTLRHIRSENKVPAIQNANGSGAIFMLDSELVGGAATNAAIENQGAMMLRNVKQNGYGTFVSNPGFVGDLKGDYAAEWMSRGAKVSYAAFPSPFKTLNLPIEETPLVPWDDPKDWVGITDLSQPDDSAAIQAAFDKAAAQGKTTVYFPAGVKERSLAIGKTIRIHGSVRRFIGNNCVITLTGDVGGNNDLPIFDIDVDSPVFVAERFTVIEWNKKKFYAFKHTKGQTVVLRDFVTHEGYRGGPAGSRVFVENIASSPLTFTKGQKAWLRTPNPEDNNAMIRNKGADVVVLGIKTESSGGIIAQVSDGGRTEVFGGEQYPSWNPQDMVKANMWRGMFDVQEGSQGSFSTSAYAWRGDFGYDANLRETRDGKTEILGREGSFGGRGGDENYLLTTAYRGTAKTPPAPVTNVAATMSDGPRQAQIAWQSDGKNVEAFRIERAGDDNKWEPVVVVPAAIRQYMQSGLQTGAKLRYRVTAFNTAGYAKPVESAAFTVSDNLKTGSGTGLRAFYFGNTEMNGTPKVRLEGPINWNTTPAGMPELNFTASYQGFLEAPATDLYRIVTSTDDGARLWIDGKLVIDAWQNFAEKRATLVRLEAGKKYPIRFDYLQLGGGAGAQLLWAGVNANNGDVKDPKLQPIPASQLYPIASETFDVPRVSVAAATAKIEEKGAPGKFVFKRSGDLSAPLSVAYYMTGTASRSIDYVAPVGVAAWKAGEAETSVSIAPIDIAEGKPDQDITLNLVPQGPLAITKGVATMTLAAHDLEAGQGGLLAEYFDVTARGVEVDGQKGDQVVKVAEQNANLPFLQPGRTNGTAPEAVNKDQFTARWSGQIVGPTTGKVLFHFVADDGLRFWIDGKPLHNNWPGFTGDRTIPVEMEQGKKYPIIIELTQNKGGYTFMWDWSTEDGVIPARTEIPFVALYPGKPTGKIGDKVFMPFAPPVPKR